MKPVLFCVLLGGCSARVHFGPTEAPEARALDAALEAWDSTGIDTPDDCYAYALTVRKAPYDEFRTLCDVGCQGVNSCARPDTVELLLAPGVKVDADGEPVVTNVIAVLESCAGARETGARELASELYRGTL